MAKILDAQEVREIVSPNIAFDLAYYDGNIEFAQIQFLKPVLSPALYEDFIAQLPSLPAAYQKLLNNYIKYIVAYGTAVLTQKKDLQHKTDNQGMMTNRTEWTSSAEVGNTKGVLMQHYERVFHYQLELATYLLENEAIYPFFDITKAELYLNFRDFIKY